MMGMPLAGLRVLDLTAHRAGPTAVRQLADWGAAVIKIEPPGSGDVVGGSRHGFDFQNLHRNKRSMTLNLKHPEGRDIFFKLAENADVVVENYRSDVKQRLGIAYEAVAKINPRIVYGSISGFGQTGPDATRPGVDQIAQGLGGLMSITGLPGQGPVRVGIPIADLTAGLLLAQAILLALFQRNQTGKGQWVHTSLLEAQIFMLDFQAARWLIAGEVARQAGNDHPTGVPTGVFPTSDGHINIAAAGDGLWKRLCAAIGAPELPAVGEFASPQQRSKNRKALNERIAAITKEKSSAHWIKLLNSAGVPCGSINSIDQTFAEPQVEHLAIARPMPHPHLGDLRVVGQPITLSSVPRPEAMRPTPELGQHSREVLGELGFDEGAMASLRTRGVV
jgi:formyl-CoA transferase